MNESPQSLAGYKLAPYGFEPSLSKGREYYIEPDRYRSAFQRDRDRIIHSKSFRRLEYKTQVFVNHEGDHYRTRLTHSLETSQIARTLARSLQLNSDLVEAIALGHDLGHTPFGHSGEDALNDILEDGFRHYEQGVRVVESVEEKYLYKGHRGLNLSWEVREGILKHTSWRERLRKDKFTHLEPETPPTLEAQVVALSDQIAFVSHDIDDGLRSNLITEEELKELLIYAKLRGSEKPWYRKIIPFFVNDIVEQTRENISKAKLNSPQKARELDDFLVRFSEEVQNIKSELGQFLTDNLYYDPHVIKMREEGKKTIRGLYNIYFHQPEKLPPKIYQTFQEQIAESSRNRRSVLEDYIRDYIAGMTDRFAFQVYEELGPSI